MRVPIDECDEEGKCLVVLKKISNKNQFFNWRKKSISFFRGRGFKMK